MKQSLGLVEIQGLTTAVVVADTMAKAANVRIVELENSKGLGYMTIKIIGDVGAVNAAVNAGRQVGMDNGKLVSWKVIARPSDYVEQTFCMDGGMAMADAAPIAADRPVEQTEQSGPDKPVEPAVPAETDEPIEPVAPAETDEPANPSEPAVPDEPANPTDPASDAEPASSKKPGARKTSSPKNKK